jgi:23S rRNA pseudouridine955/2504/2580 synthase
MSWEISVPRGEEPKRLENFLKKLYPIGYVRKVFRKSAVRLNGNRSGPEDTVRPGDRVELFIPFEKKAKGKKTDVSPPDLKIEYENNEFLVVHKPAGIAVHEGKEILKRHSLLGRLEAAYRAKGVTPRLVHRLDKETSGLLLVAKKEGTAARLEEMIEEGKVEKGYVVLVVGRLHARRGAIDFPLPGRSGEPVSALTLYRVEKELPGTTLVRVTIKTGRMHQIRLHFAKFGHPVVMDRTHGDFEFNRRFRKAHGLKRQFLHAATLGLEYDGKQYRWTAPLPEDLQKALQSLEIR